jgi:hypothetical protein
MKQTAVSVGEDGSRRVVDLSADNPELEREAALAGSNVLAMPTGEIASRLAFASIVQPYAAGPISWRRLGRAQSRLRRPARHISRRGSSRRPSGRRTRRTVAARRARSEPHLDGEPPPEPDPPLARALWPALVGGGR